MSDVTKITVNGREYDSVDHMPPDVREIYLKAMAALGEAGKTGAQKSIGLQTVKESFTYNGREYKSRDELPPEVRALFDKIPQLSPDAIGSKIEDVKVLTEKTIIPGRNRAELWGLNEDRSERDPKVAWMLVAILSTAVIFLLFLLYLANIRHK